MLIQCTKKLLDRLKTKPETSAEENSIFSWHANMVTINRRQAIVLMNDKTRYVIVMYGFTARDFSRFNQWVIQAIREVFLYEGIKEEVIEQYLEDAGDMTFTKTKDRTHVARLNQATSNTESFSESIGLIEGVNEQLSAKVSRLIVTDGGSGYIQPNEEMFEELTTYYEKDIFSMKAAEMKVTLQLDDYEVFRTLIVPLNRTFTQFHRILQTTFAWMDYHLHEFYLLDANKTGEEIHWVHPAYTEEGYKPMLHFVSDEEAFDFSGDIEMKLEEGIRLSTYIPDFKVLTYHYDFGDSWRHQIEVTRVIEDYNNPHPVCTDGAGTAPPEDVGGEGGFTEFLKVIENPEDPDYNQMQQWMRGQGYQEFDLERINKMLQSK